MKNVKMSEKTHELLKKTSEIDKRTMTAVMELAVENYYNEVVSNVQKQTR